MAPKAKAKTTAIPARSSSGRFASETQDNPSETGTSRATTPARGPATVGSMRQGVPTGSIGSASYAGSPASSSRESTEERETISHISKADFSSDIPAIEVQLLQKEGSAHPPLIGKGPEEASGSTDAESVKEVEEILDPKERAESEELSNKGKEWATAPRSRSGSRESESSRVTIQGNFPQRESRVAQLNDEDARMLRQAFELSNRAIQIANEVDARGDQRHQEMMRTFKQVLQNHNSSRRV